MSNLQKNGCSLAEHFVTRLKTFINFSKIRRYCSILSFLKQRELLTLLPGNVTVSKDKIIRSESIETARIFVSAKSRDRDRINIYS